MYNHNEANFYNHRLHGQILIMLDVGSRTVVKIRSLSVITHPGERNTDTHALHIHIHAHSQINNNSIFCFCSSVLNQRPYLPGTGCDACSRGYVCQSNLCKLTFK